MNKDFNILLQITHEEGIHEGRTTDNVWSWKTTIHFHKDSPDLYIRDLLQEVRDYLNRTLENKEMEGNKDMYVKVKDL